MNTNPDFDRHAAAWLADGPTELNDRVLEAALREVHLTGQRRRLAIPRRLRRMPTYLRPAVGVAIAAILAVGLVAFVNRPTGVGVAQATRTPSVVPSTSPTVVATVAPTLEPTVEPTHTPIDTTGWVPYASEQYGFTLLRPADWAPHPAVRPWTFARDGAIDPTSTAMDSFVSPDDAVAVSFWAINGETLAGGPVERIHEQPDLASWVTQWCGITGNSTCDGVADRAIPMCLEYPDCHPALMVTYAFEIQAYFTDPATQTVVVVAIWRPEDSHEAQPHGGSKAILERFLSGFNGGDDHGVWPAGYLPPGVN